MNKVGILRGSLLLLVVLSATMFLLAPGKVFATSGINQELSFEGKIVTTSGINIPDGTYNMQFQIYTGCTNNTGSGCTSVWSENWLVGSTPVTFSSGTFQVNLGQITSLSSIPAADWNTYPLYLSLEIGNTATPLGSCVGTANFATNCGGDGVMSPYILLTSTPYSFDSSELGGIASTGYIQTAPSSAQQIQPTSNTTGLVVLQNSNASPTADIFDVQTVNSTDAIQVTGPSLNTANVVINAIGTANNVMINPAGTGTLSLGTLATANTIQIGSTSLASGTQTINIGNNSGGGIVALTIGSTNSTSSVTIAGGSGTSINIGTGGIANTIQVGNTSGAVSQTTNIGTNATTSGTNVVDIGNAATATDTVSIGSSSNGSDSLTLDSGTGTTALFNAATNHTIQLATGAGVEDVTIGSTNSTSSLTLQGGTGTSINIGTGGIANTIQIGNTSGAVAQTIDLGNNSTASSATTTNLGSTIGTSTTNINSGTGNINLATSGGGDVDYSEGAGSQLSISASAVPNTSQLSITNVGQAVTTAGVSALTLNYTGGAAAVAAAGETIDYTPGTTSGGTWSGLSVIATGSGAASGVTDSGISLTGPSPQGAGKEYAISIGANWDAGLNITAAAAVPTVLPSASTLDLYTIQQAGRTMLASTDSNGNSFAYQPSLYQQSIFLCSLASTTTVSAIGGACAIGDNATTAFTTTQAAGAGVTLTSAATTDSEAGVWQATSNYFLGNAANSSNGFFYFSRLFLNGTYGTGATGSDFFMGLSDQTTINTMVSSANPAGNYAGIQYSDSRGDADWMCVTKNNTTQSTPASSGLAFTTGDVYDFYVYAPPEGTTIYMQVNNDTTGTSGTCSSSTDLPTSTTAMRPEAFMGTLTTTARALVFEKMYVESDR